MSLERREWHACPACDERASEPFVEFVELAFVRCAGCGAVYKRFEAAALRADDFYERGYFHGRRSGRDRRFSHRVRKAMEWVRSALELAPRARALLDVGCSFGYVIEAGRRLGLTSSGTDVSRYAVEACRQRGLEARVGTLEQLPFADQAFDVVVMKHVLEHTAAPKAALAELRRVLKPGGVVVIAVPDLQYWKGQRRRKTYRYFRPDDLGAQHYVYYSASSLAGLLTRCGFEPVVQSKAFFRARLASSAWWRRLWEPLRYLAISALQSVATAGLRRELFVIARRC
ncbi:MAG: class I SAM-dependent methyltransferase [Archangiaceae bacterium]|nr:class I SAM-dependent methyltransferase [Archangiaceae bacterium]